MGGGEKMDKEFCLNSGQWIFFMILKGSPPITCPFYNCNFIKCEECEYYEKRKVTEYFINKQKKLIKHNQ